MASREICFLTACELARRIRSKDVSAREVMAAHLAQVERVNPAVNAIVTLHPEAALADARAADEALAHGQAIGALHGVPVAHKDLVLKVRGRHARSSCSYPPLLADRLT